MLKSFALLKKGDAAAVEALEKTAEVAEAAGDAATVERTGSLLSNYYLKEAANANTAKKWNDVLTNAEKSLKYEKSEAGLKLKDLANYRLGESLKDRNKAKACEHFRKVTSDAQLKAAAAQMIKALCN